MPLREGMGRRLSKRDIKGYIKEQMSPDNGMSRVESIVADVHEIDASQKKLTGRRAEQYAEESGIELKDLFPEGKEVLNVGDPWQTLDLPGVTSIDYEFGEEAEFQREPDVFLKSLPGRVEIIQRFLGYEPSSDSGKEDIARIHELVAQKFNNLVPALNSPNLDDYIPLADGLRILRDSVQQLRDLDEGAWSYRELWFELDKLDRGLRDVHLMETVIQPTLDITLIREKLSHEELEVLFGQLIEQHRFVKKTKHARIVKATFPDVPFEDKSFDRITASWSLSTHMFPEMNREDFNEYWETMNRLLREGGSAYMWPLYRGNESTLFQSLKEYRESGGNAEIVVFDEWDDDDGRRISIDDPEFEYFLEEAQTLIVYPRSLTL